MKTKEVNKETIDKKDSKKGNDNHKPKLYINLKAVSDKKLQDEFYKEIEDGSITPTTFESRSFLIDQMDFFRDTYSFKQTSVERFGLNLHSNGLLKLVNDYNNQTKKESLVSPSLSSVGSKKSKKSNNKDQKKINEIKLYIEKSEKLLTKVEIANTKKTIKYLADNKNAKVAIFDLFERDSDNNIAIENKSPKTHTVVLYEKQGKYLVIDPSNATFSHILTGADENIRVCFNKKLQIYKIPEIDLDGKKIDAKIGSKFSEWRDCIDIAVKLAFNLKVNHSKLKIDDKIQIIDLDSKQNIGYIDPNSLKENHSIKTITNQTSLFNKLYYKVKQEPMRIKQSSDVLQNKKTTVLLTTLESVTSNLNKILEEKNLVHSLKDFNKKEKKLVQELFSEQDYKKLLQNELKYFSNTLSPYYGIVKDEVELLAKTEFEQIDKQFN